MEEVCNICVIEYNNQSRTKCVCPYCNFNSCCKCIQQFLMTSTSINPICMSCKAILTLEYVSSITPKSFHNNNYRLYRTKIILEREKSLLPMTQELVQNQIIKNENIKNIKLLNDEEIVLKNRIIDIRKKVRNLRYKNRSLTNTTEETKEREEKKFIKPCPVNNCRGYLNSLWKCGICNTWVCNDCNNIKESRVDEQHICNKDEVETVKLINIETKPCPSCNTRIYKIEGCDQMWCVQCKTAFSWRHGRIEKGVIHNPHFYQWQKTLNNGVIPRTVGDIECGGLPNFNTFYSKLRKLFRIEEDVYDTDKINVITEVYRLINHIEQVELIKYPNNPDTIENNYDLRIKFLMNEINEEKFIHKLKKREKKREKDREIHLIYNMIKLSLLEIILSLNACSLKQSDKAYEQYNILEPLRIYVNKNLYIVHNRFLNTVWYFKNGWSMTRNFDEC